MKLLREIAYQCLILATIFSLTFVAYDLSSPAASAFDKVDEQTAVKVFSSLSEIIHSADDKSGELASANISYIKNILLPFIIYLLACGGFAFLILENIRQWKVMSQIAPFSKLMWAAWVIVLGLMSMVLVYLGTCLFLQGLWYVFIVIAILLLFFWMHWASKIR